MSKLIEVRTHLRSSVLTEPIIPIIKNWQRYIAIPDFDCLTGNGTYI